MCMISSSTITMTPSLAGGHIMQRNVSSLSTDSSEFEFDPSSFPELNDEPPLSPKLLYSPNFSPNYSSPNVESTAPPVASNNQFSADQDVHASKSASVEQQGYDDHLPASFTLKYEAPPSVSTAGEENRINLRSLLKRRDLEHLPPLTNYNIKLNDQINNKDIRKQVFAKRNPRASTSSSSAYSPSSSPINYHANHYANPCKFEDNHPDYAGDASPSESKSGRKKCRKWAFKLDFLRKTSSPRGEHEAQNQSSNDKLQVEAGSDDYLHEGDDAAGEARFNQQINQSINSNYLAADAAREARFNHQINQSMDNYGAAAAMISKFESPRQSTCSVMSSVSSSPRHADNEMIRANHGKISKSAPASPAASPPRSVHAGESALTRGRATMSPHALHYEQQRARNEDMRRKTFLPYRQSLLSACFFPPQAVY